MARWNSLVEGLILSVRNWRLWLLQFIGNAAIFAVFLGWLRVPDAHWWQLLFQFLLMVLMAAAVLVLHGGTLNYFQSAHLDKTTPLPPAFLRALKHILAIAVCLLVFYFLRTLVGRLDDYEQSFPGYLRSGFPAWLRRMINEPALDNLYSGFVSLLRWVVLPGLLLPFALFSADRGFRGWIALRDWSKTVGSITYWTALVAAAVIGVYLVQLIMGWKLDPNTSTLRGEEASFVTRQLLAYLLVLFAWLLTCSMLGRRRAVRQPSA